MFLTEIKPSFGFSPVRSRAPCNGFAGNGLTTGGNRATGITVSGRWPVRDLALWGERRAAGGTIRTASN